MGKSWAVGVTTCGKRIEDGTLTKTLSSIHATGFPKPWLFVDGMQEVPLWEDNRTLRHPITPFANWWLGLCELYVRNPAKQMYAMFQDDVTFCLGVREYLDRCRYPDGYDGRERGYWNLFTFRNSEYEIEGSRQGWVQGAVHPNMPENRQQCGRGALAYVFSREAVFDLLASPAIIEKPASQHFPDRNIDGAVVTAMNLAGWREYVHGPTLVQHAGVQSAIGDKVWENFAKTFRGEDWNVLELLR